MFPFNITNPGIYIEGLLTSQEASFVTNLVGLTPNDGDTFIYDTGTGLWTVGPGGGSAVDSVNGQTGVVILDADDIDDTSTTNKFVTASEISKLAGIEAGADVTDAANVNAAGAVMDSDYTPAHSLLVQQSGTGSPTALQISNDTILGRLSGGGSNIAALTASDVRTLTETETTTQLNTRDTNNRARANHTGTQLATTISDFASAVAATPAVTANTAKVSNATHTGDMAGDTALTAQPALITGKTTVTPVSGDFLLISDASDSGNLKKVDASAFLGGGGGGITEAQARAIARRYALALG